MNETDSTKRIPKSLGTDAKLFGTYTLSDLAVALLPGVVVVLCMQILVPSTLTIAGYRPQTLTIPLAGAAIVIGALFVYLTPAYTTSLDWFGTFASFHRRSSEATHDEAKRYTQIERVHREKRTIERTDGTFLALVQVSPPAMALATDEEWAAKAEAFRDFVNTAVQFPIQIYSTTQPFPVDEYLGRYSSRLGDRDVKDNPRLARLIDEYVSWYATDLGDRRMTIRDHYVIVPVSPRDVQFERESLIEKLAVIPVLGLFVLARYAPRVEDQREAMFDALDERTRQIAAGLREIDGCDARRVDAETATNLVGEYWAGEPREYGDLSRKLRSAPIVRGPQ